jgi:hypothetical protein
METVLIVLLVVLLLGGGAGATLVGGGSAPLALDLLRESLITQTLSFRSYAARPTLRVSLPDGHILPFRGELNA